MKFHSILSLCILLPTLFLSSCSLNGKSDDGKEKQSDEGESTYKDAMLPNATDDQTKALSEVVEPDSTDLVRNYKYGGCYIYVSKPKMRLYVLDRNDSVLFSCGIACGIRKGDKQGREDFRTPEGRFRISGMFDSTDWIHRTKDGRESKGCYGPYFLRLATGRFSGIGIHGTNAPRSIGRRASEGCIRVKSQNIITIHDFYAYEGMPVIVSGERERLPAFAGLDSEVRNAGTLAQKMGKDSTVIADSATVATPSRSITSSKEEYSSDTLVITQTI